MLTQIRDLFTATLTSIALFAAPGCDVEDTSPDALALRDGSLAGPSAETDAMPAPERFDTVVVGRERITIRTCDLEVQDCPTGQVCLTLSGGPEPAPQVPGCVDIVGADDLAASAVVFGEPVLVPSCDLEANDCPTGQVCLLSAPSKGIEGAGPVCVDIMATDQLAP